jgi:hypothetical protein
MRSLTKKLLLTRLRLATRAKTLYLMGKNKMKITKALLLISSLVTVLILIITVYFFFNKDKAIKKELVKYDLSVKNNITAVHQKLLDDPPPKMGKENLDYLESQIEEGFRKSRPQVKRSLFNEYEKDGHWLIQMLAISLSMTLLLVLYFFKKKSKEKK